MVLLPRMKIKPDPALYYLTFQQNSGLREIYTWNKRRVNNTESVLNNAQSGLSG